MLGNMKKDRKIRAVQAIKGKHQQGKKAYEMHSKIALEQIPIEDARKAESLQNIAQAVEKKRYRYKPSHWEILRGQIKYISSFYLGGQLSCLLVIILTIGYLQEQGADMLAFLGAGSVLSSYMGVFLILELSRSQSCGMMEIEQTCYLNIKQVWCMKMIVFGSLDILLLTSLVLGVVRNVNCGIFQTMVYLLLPFFVSNILQLLVFTIMRKGKRGYLQMSIAVLLSCISLIPLSYPGIYTVAYFGIWLFGLAVALAVLITEIVTIYGRLEEICEVF